MAGMPKMRKLVRTVDDAGGPELVCEQIAEGMRVGEVAKLWGVSRRMLYAWRDRMERDRGGVKEMWEEAIKLSAEADVEKSLEQFDRLDRLIEVGKDEEGNAVMVHRVPEAAEVSLATSKARFNQWLAARKDPARYGERSTVDVNHNLGDLHLEALQSAKRLNRPTVEAETDEDNVQEVDYEVV